MELLRLGRSAHTETDEEQKHDDEFDLPMFVDDGITETSSVVVADRREREADTRIAHIWSVRYVIAAVLIGYGGSYFSSTKLPLYMWLYFSCGFMQFYPLLLLSWSRKTTQGISFDTLVMYLWGSMLNMSYIGIKVKYCSFDPSQSDEKVWITQLMLGLSVYDVISLILVIMQCFWYDSKTQKLQKNYFYLILLSMIVIGADIFSRYNSGGDNNQTEMGSSNSTNSSLIYLNNVTNTDAGGDNSRGGGSFSFLFPESCHDVEHMPGMLIINILGSIFTVLRFIPQVVVNMRGKTYKGLDIGFVFLNLCSSACMLTIAHPADFTLDARYIASGFVVYFDILLLFQSFVYYQAPRSEQTLLVGEDHNDDAFDADSAARNPILSRRKTASTNTGRAFDMNAYFDIQQERGLVRRAKQEARAKRPKKKTFQQRLLEMSGFIDPEAQEEGVEAGYDREEGDDVGEDNMMETSTLIPPSGKGGRDDGDNILLQKKMVGAGGDNVVEAEALPMDRDEPDDDDTSKCSVAVDDLFLTDWELNHITDAYDGVVYGGGILGTGMAGQLHPIHPYDNTHMFPKGTLVWCCAVCATLNSTGQPYCSECGEEMHPDQEVGYEDEFVFEEELQEEELQEEGEGEYDSEGNFIEWEEEGEGGYYEDYDGEEPDQNMYLKQQAYTEAHGQQHPQLLEGSEGEDYEDYDGEAEGQISEVSDSDGAEGDPFQLQSQTQEQEQLLMSNDALHYTPEVLDALSKQQAYMESHELQEEEEPWDEVEEAEEAGEAELSSCDDVGQIQQGRYMYVPAAGETESGIDGVYDNGTEAEEGEEKEEWVDGGSV